MQPNTNDYVADVPKPNDEISLVEIANIILRNWRIVATLPLAIAFLMIVWTVGQPRTYTASATFIPQVAEGGSTSGAATLAQQFGVSLGAERPGQSPHFYVDLLESVTLLRETVQTTYSVPTEDGELEYATLVEFFDLDNEPGPVPAWRRAVDDELRESISTSVDRETSVVSLNVSVPDPALAEQIAQRLLELLNKFNLEVRQNRAEEEGRFISDRIAEAERELLTAENELQEFLRQNRQFENSPELIFEHDRLQRQVAMRQNVYTSLLRSLEEARIDAVRDTPLLTVIDHPAGAAEPEDRGILLHAMFGLLLGLMIAVPLVFARELSRRSRDTNNPHYLEFRGLASQAWQDIRRPRLWFRSEQK